jgi:hypothetical protein
MLNGRLLRNYWEALLNCIPQHMQRASFALQSRASLHREHFIATDHSDLDKDFAANHR